MKRATLAAVLLAGLTAAGTAWGESLSGQDRSLFRSDGTTLRSTTVQERAYSRTPDSPYADPAPTRDSHTRDALKVWWQ